MSEQDQSSEGYKRISLDRFIQTVSVDYENPHDNYVQFAASQQQTLSHNWGGYSACQPGHFMTNRTVHSAPPDGQSLGPLSSSLYMDNIASYEPLTADQIYFPQQNIDRSMTINENDNLMKTIEVNESNFINVVYNPSNTADNCQLPAYMNQRVIGSEYGLFTNQNMSMTNESSTQNLNGKQLIDNLVGNWVPNQSGTYSPFGGSPNVSTTSQTSPEVKKLKKIPRTSLDSQIKKPRIVAEVKPMRPSYSDILTKSAPTPPSPLLTPPVKPKIGTAAKKVSIKNAKNKGKSSTLRRQNSSGSDDHNSPKMPASRNIMDKENCNLPRRWVSLDNLDAQTDFRGFSVFDKCEQFEKKKVPKSTKNTEVKNTETKSTETKKVEKTNETLNNTKIPSTNSKAPVTKRPIQINNNLNTINSASQTMPPEKLEKNQQTINKINKSEKKIPKEKNLKRSHAEKATQIKKGQRNRKKDNKDSSIKDISKNLYKHITRWSKLALKVFYWFLHLICDVVTMSINLVIQLGKCGWYHTLLYLKYSRNYIINTVSRIRMLNSFIKWIDGWFGNSKYAFWRKKKCKNEKSQDEHTNWTHNGLESNIALPSTGEEAMKRLLACKGKDPYSILGVTPTCSDDDIKKYYKRQAFLVHPDKNNQPGAEEAFKILVHAFDIIGEPERRQAFDQTMQVEAAWNELSDLLSQLHRKMEQAANTIRCTNCGLRHKRIPTQRPCYAARFCAQCKICHSAKEGDIWAESRLMGFQWYYYACMEGAVYDVTDWAACQAGNLKHLRANTHSVQYRIVLGQRASSQTPNSGKKRHTESHTSEADIEDFLNNLYQQSKSTSQTPPGEQNSFRNDSRRRKTKRKK